MESWQSRGYVLTGENDILGSLFTYNASQRHKSTRRITLPCGFHYQQHIFYLYDVSRLDFYVLNYCFSANVKSLTNTVVNYNSMHFVLRSRTDHENPRWGDIELKAKSEEKCLQYSKRALKTRTRETSEARSFTPKILED